MRESKKDLRRKKEVEMVKKVVSGMLIILLGCFLGYSKGYGETTPAINVDRVLNLFSTTIQDILNPIENYLSSVTFRVMGQSIVSEDANGNITFYGEFGPQKMYDKEGNLLREWFYKNGQLEYVVNHRDDGNYTTYYENGRPQIELWVPSSIFDQIGNLNLEKETVSVGGKDITGYVSRRFVYNSDGTLKYVEEQRLNLEEIGSQGASPNGSTIKIKGHTYSVEPTWQRTYYDGLGRISEVRSVIKNDDGTETEAIMRKYVYDNNGILDHVDVYGGEKNSEPTVTARIYYVGGRPDRAVRVDNGAELDAVAQVVYNGARIDRITGPGDLIRALGYGVTSDEEGLTLKFNDMGLPDYVKNSAGAIIQKWLYSWDDFVDENGDGRIDSQDVIAMFGWDSAVEGAEDVADTLLNIKTNTDLPTVRLLAILTLSSKKSGDGSSFDGKMYVNEVNLLGMFAIDTSGFDPEPEPDPASSDPAVTGGVYQDNQGNWHMQVMVWTNKEKTEWGKVDITLDLSSLGDQDLANIENILADYADSGQNLTLYGLTPTGEISQGYTLQVLGLGKGPFEEHPFDL